MLLKPSEVWYARNAVTVRMQEAADRKEREKLCTNTFPFEKSVVLGSAGNQHGEGFAGAENWAYSHGWAYQRSWVRQGTWRTAVRKGTKQTCSGKQGREERCSIQLARFKKVLPVQLQHSK